MILKVFDRLYTFVHWWCGRIETLCTESVHNVWGCTGE